MAQTIRTQTALGQYYHHPGGDTVYPTVTTQEVATELRNRGYQISVPYVPVAVPEAVLSKYRAINIALDTSIDAYNVEHSTRRPYVCPRYGASMCNIVEGTWNAVVSYATTLANGYLSGRYSLPTWAASEYLHGGISGYGYDLGYGLGGLVDWLTDNPEVLSIIGAGFAAAGAALTARRVQELLKANVPKDYLTKAELPQLLAALQQQGQPGQSTAISKGAQAATMPSWLMPVLIGGGFVGLMLVMGRR